MNQISAYDSYEQFKRKLYVFIVDKGGDPEYSPFVNVLMEWASAKEKEIIELNGRTPDANNPYWEYTDGACKIYQMCWRGEPYEQGRYYAYDPTNPYWKHLKAFLEWEDSKHYDHRDSLTQLALHTQRPKQALFKECQEFFDSLEKEDAGEQSESSAEGGAE